MPTFQPSPYQMQPPAFTSPLEQLMTQTGGAEQAGPSRGALLERAFSLTRSPSARRFAPGEQHTGARGLQRSRRVSPSDASADQQSLDHVTTQDDYRTLRQRTYTSESTDSNGSSHSVPNALANSDKERVQSLRAARLSLQQNASPQASPLLQQRSPDSATSVKQARESPEISNAFRDSFVSFVSFNSITGEDERLSFVQSNANGPAKADFSAGTQHRSPRQDRSSPNRFADDSFVQDADRIAQEVRGLALRRRPSMDTVRSSEFGDGGRWAKAWGSSQDGSDNEDEDEMTLQDMRARDMTDLDFEATGTHVHSTSMDALGALGNLQGAYAAMSRPSERFSRNRGGASLPRLQDAAAAAHTVNLMPSQHKSSLVKQQNTELSPAYITLSGQASGLSRRDTIISIAGEVLDMGDECEQEGSQSHHQQRHNPNDSNVTNSSRGDSDGKQHVMVWPPSPAKSQQTGERSLGSGQAHAARDAPRAVTSEKDRLGYDGSIDSAAPEVPGKDDVRQSQYRVQSRKPLSPSELLKQRTPEEGIYGHAGRPAERYHLAAGYDDPNLNRIAGHLGRMRRKAIEDHDGRESMVSDLDVETLRLDGSSQAGDSRRDSTSTIGSVSSIELEQQRRRRSQMERHDVYDDRRSSTATVRMAPRLPPPPPSSARISPGSTGAARPISHPSPVKEKLDPFRHAPLQPRRSNTMPDEQPGTPKTPDAPWSASARSAGDRPSQLATSPNMSTAHTAPSPSIRSTMNTPLGAANEVKRSSALPPVQSPAEKFLTLGISHHESGDLSRSAYYFERSAKVEGGCVVGMCMWGMALREGWGVRKDQKRGFEWISRAASRAGEMMSGPLQGGGGRTESELKAIRSELKLSVYELGKCFCYGWGVKMDKPMALEYFELAAKLGDSDAQAEAGALLAAGKGGCKKDLKKAAMYYRMAEAQGYDTVGLSWIHKDKYDPIPSTIK